MAFPSTVVADLRSGLIGELSHDVPYVGIVATAAAAVTIGNACTYTDQPTETVSMGGTGVFAGIAVNPKSTTLGTSNAVATGAPVELMQGGEVYVQLSTAANIGDDVYFVNATGALGAGTAGSGQTQIEGATVVRHVASSETPRLAIVRILS